MAAADIRIEPFDASAATDGELLERYEFGNAIDRESDPDDPALPFDVWRKELHDVPSWTKPMRWSAFDGAGRLVGVASLSLQYTETNRHLANFWIAVGAEARRQRTATRLLRSIVDAAEADGRTSLKAHAEEGSPGEGFLAAAGMERRLVDRRSRLLVNEVDQAMLDQWIAAAATNAADYSLLVWDSETPAEHLHAFVDLEHVMNTAPRDDLEQEDWVNTPERFIDDERRALASGYRWWTIVARHDPTGELAGFTSLGFAPGTNDIAWQLGTAVRPEHRNHGIGRWIKAAMLKKLSAERPDVWRIDTWNAGSNKTMLGINVALGFRPVKHYGAYQASTEKIAAALAERGA